MRPKRPCKHCLTSDPNHWPYQCPKNPKKRKPIPKRGKRYYEYEEWKRDIAIPFLNAKYGHVCADCGLGDYGIHILQVEHKKTRGSRADLKMDLDNVQWLGAYPCHYNKTNHLGKYKEYKEHEI